MSFFQAKPYYKRHIKIWNVYIEEFRCISTPTFLRVRGVQPWVNLSIYCTTFRYQNPFLSVIQTFKGCKSSNCSLTTTTPSRDLVEHVKYYQQAYGGFIFYGMNAKRSAFKCLQEVNVLTVAQIAAVNIQALWFYR